MEVRKVKIADITVPERKRGLNEDNVWQKATSIDEIGLINPITLREGNILVAGLHRLEACKYLEWEEIDAMMFEDLSELEAEKVEIDENFQQCHLTKLQECQQALRRREIWEIEHGVIKRGPEKGQKGGDSHQLGQTTCIAYIARLLDITRGGAYAVIKVAQDLDPEVQKTIEGLPICDNRSELKRLAALPVDEQVLTAAGLADGTVERVPVPEEPPVGEDASPQTPQTPQTPQDGNRANWNRKVKEAIREIKGTIKLQLKELDENGGHLPESTESVILQLNQQITGQLNSLRI